MSDETPPPLVSWREIVLGLFPFLARFRVRPKEEGGGLEIKSAAARIEIEGGGPAVARVGDLVVRLAFYPGVPGTTPPSLWASTSIAAPYAWSQVATTIITGPTTSDAGTAVTMAAGSGKVTCG